MSLLELTVERKKMIIMHDWLSNACWSSADSILSSNDNQTYDRRAGKPFFFAKLSVLVFMLYQTMITWPDDDIDFVRMRNSPGQNYRCFRETLKQVFFSVLTAFNLCNPMTTRKFCAINKNLLQKYKK